MQLEPHPQLAPRLALDATPGHGSPERHLAVLELQGQAQQRALRGHVVGGEEQTRLGQVAGVSQPVRFAPAEPHREPARVAGCGRAGAASRDHRAGRVRRVHRGSGSRCAWPPRRCQELHFVSHQVAFLHAVLADKVDRPAQGLVLGPAEEFHRVAAARHHPQNVGKGNDSRAPAVVRPGHENTVSAYAFSGFDGDPPPGFFRAGHPYV